MRATQIISTENLTSSILAIFAFFITCLFARAEESRIFTFQDLNILSDDLVLKGVNPKYDFYLPTLPQMLSGSVHMKALVSPHLREDSTLSILVDDVPYKTYKVRELPPDLIVPFSKKKNRDFVKISLVGNLRTSNNICEDIFSDKIWLVIKKDSYVAFTYRKYQNIREFLRDYNSTYWVDSPQLIPLVYQICKYSPIACSIKYGTSTDCKNIIYSEMDLLELKGNTLFVPALTSLAFEKGVFPSLLFGGSQKIEKVQREPKKVKKEVSLRDLGIGTTSVDGVGNLSFTVPLDLSKIGGLPDKIFFRLFIEHTPLHKKDNMELRVYLNNKMIFASPLEGSGKKSFDIELPTEELMYGTNYVRINLVNFISSDNCFGAVSHSVLTVFGDSYFYWNNAKNDPKTISDFLRSLSGYVAIIIKDSNFNPFAIYFVSQLGIYNKNIELIDLNPKDLSKYDFLIFFESPRDTKGRIIDLSKGDFDIINPLTKNIIFSSKPSEPFATIMVEKMEKKPSLIFSYYPNNAGIGRLFLYNLRDMFKLSGNVAVATEDFISAYEVGKKLRVKYKYEKSLSYYWNKYKLWIVLFGIIPVSLFLVYVYRKLTGRPQM